MRKRRVNSGLVILFLLTVILSGCSDSVSYDSHQNKPEASITSLPGDNSDDQNTQNQKMESQLMEIQSSKILEEDSMKCFDNIELTKAVKGFGFKNPLMTQRLGADPYALVYNDRVYLYMTGDVVEYDKDGKVINNSYSKINTLNVISSADLVNWTDHGAIKAAGREGASTWGNNSWAPAAAYKKIDGKDKFFLYFANGGNGIGVLTSDSPTGPFVDPLGHALISRSTPNCANVAWLFDPAVLVDDDGTGYLYFGGGIPNNQFANPGTGRAVKLGEDMISLAGDPVSLDIPYLFEDSGINKIGDTYYYSYCSNWNVASEDTAKLGINNADIVYMTSKNPLGPFTLQKPILRNPGVFFGVWGNNHHCMFKFNDTMYMAYHSQMLEQKLGITGGYRSTNIDQVTVNEDGTIDNIKGTEFGVKQIKSLNPYDRCEAETMGTMAGISTVLIEESGNNSGTGNMAVTDIHTGDWIAIYGADFGEKGANRFTVMVKPPKEAFGAIQIRLDKPTGDVIGYLKVDADNTGEYREITIELLTSVTGEHNLVFVFYGEGYDLDYWYFE
jgi:arabinoxylan arabinofuranohydrolase